jgi:RHS repeat-associated protein
VFSLSYGYGATNNSQIASIVNNLNNNRTQNFTYDTLRRLSTAQSQATSGADCWGQSFPAYDRWGNKPTDTVTKCTAPALSVTIASASNRITSTGFAYDTAGDLTNENGPTYTWNAEEQITAAAGVTYSYDGDGLRVKKSNGKMYWRSIGIAALAETDLAGNNPVEFIYFAGQRVALRDSAGGVYYIFADHLGSTRIVTDATGTVCRDLDYFPFGGEKITLNTCALLSSKFATYERDPETGLDYAIFRYYNSRLGRFMSPDLLAGSTGDPQSLNRYAYVRNDPVNLVDPLGLFESHRPPIPPLCDEGPESEGEYGFPVPSDGGGGGSPSGGGPGGGPIGGNFPNGESLGIPTGLRVQFPDLWGTLLPIDPGCEFGPCVPFGNGYQDAATVAKAAPFVLPCLASKWCQAALVLTAVAVVGYYYGTQNIVPSWAEGQRPLAGESARQFADRLCKLRYPPDGAGCGTGGKSERNRIRKWAHRKFGI